MESNLALADSDISDGSEVLSDEEILNLQQSSCSSLQRARSLFEPELLQGGSQDRLGPLMHLTSMVTGRTLSSDLLHQFRSSVSSALDAASASLALASTNVPSGSMDTDSDSNGTLQRSLTDEKRGFQEPIEDSDNLLPLACSAGYLELVQVLLALDANVNHQDNKGHCTPLMGAAGGGHTEIVKLLLQNGADVDLVSSSGDTALHYAGTGGFEEIVELLLEKSTAKLETQNENGHTPLMEAANAGHVGVAKLLIERGAGINTHSNDFKESALTLACYKGHVDMVRLLLDSGADQEHKTEEMHTALMEAAMDGHVEVAQLLLQRGAKVDMPADSFESPLTLASSGGHTLLVELLLQHGARLEEVNDEGYSPLMEAAREGHLEVCRLLARYGANINFITEETLETALTTACCGGFKNVAEFLIDAGADVNAGGSTALIEAASEGHVEVVKFLLERGANVSAQTSSGDTALTYACENGHIEIIEVLLDSGADIEHLSDGGKTPLMKAARSGHVAVVDLLLRRGAQPDRLTTGGEHNALTLTCASGHKEVADLLLRRGVDPGQRLKDGSTALIEATKAGHTRIVKQLLLLNSCVCSNPAVPVTAPPRSTSLLNDRAHCQQQSSNLPSLEQTLGLLSGRVPTRSESISSDELPSLEYNAPDLVPPLLESDGSPILGAIDVDPSALAFLTSVSVSAGGVPLPLVSPYLAIHNSYLRSARPETLVDPTRMNTEGAADGPNDVADNVDVVAEAVSATRLPSKTVASTGVQTESRFPAHLLATIQQQQQQQQVHVIPTLVPRIPTGLELDERDIPTCLSPTYALPSLCKTDTFTHSELQKLFHDTLLSQFQHGVNDATSEVSDSDSRSHAGPSSISTPPLLSEHKCRALSIDVDGQTETNHDTPLTIACAAGNEELVRVLLAHNPDIEHKDKKGNTPLLLAAAAGHAPVVRLLLDHSCNVENSSDRTRDTPLSVACSNGRFDVAELLISRRASIEHRNMSDYTPLSLAASGGYIHIINLLLDHGAEINSRTGSKLGISPLMLAAMNGHTETVRLLLDKGADINAQIETNRNTALTLACFQGRHEVVQLLLERKANSEHRAKTGLTPLMEAASGGFTECGRVLLLHGADVNASPVPSTRDTALIIACEKGHLKFVELLLQHSVHLEAKNKKGCTGFWLACAGGFLDVVRVMFNHQADVNSEDHRGVTCLMSAFKRGHERVVRLLVKHVRQFPSDQDLDRTVQNADKDILKNVISCRDVIKLARDRHAAEANKNADILLAEVDQEKMKEEERKAAMARKRANKRKNRKKVGPAAAADLESSDKSDVHEKAIDNTSPAQSPVRKEAVSKACISTTRNNQSNSRTTMSEAIVDALIIMTTYASTTTASLSRTQNSLGPDQLRKIATTVVSSILNTASSAMPSGKSAASIMSRTMERAVDQLHSLPLGATLSRTPPTSASSTASPNLVSASSASASTTSSPPCGEDEWKEVTRKVPQPKLKKFNVPGHLISRVIGRAGSNINQIREISTAFIDVDTNRRLPSGDVPVSIKGSQEACQAAFDLIQALVKDPDRDPSEILPPVSSKGVCSGSVPSGLVTQQPTKVLAKAVITATAVSVHSNSRASSTESNVAQKVPAVDLTKQVSSPRSLSAALPLSSVVTATASSSTVLDPILAVSLPTAQTGWSVSSPSTPAWNTTPQHSDSAPSVAAEAPASNQGTSKLDFTWTNWIPNNIPTAVAPDTVRHQPPANLRVAESTGPLAAVGTRPSPWESSGMPTSTLPQVFLSTGLASIPSSAPLAVRTAAPSMETHLAPRLQSLNSSEEFLQPSEDRPVLNPIGTERALRRCQMTQPNVPSHEVFMDPWDESGVFNVPPAPPSSMLMPPMLPQTHPRNVGCACENQMQDQMMNVLNRQGQAHYGDLLRESGFDPMALQVASEQDLAEQGVPWSDAVSLVRSYGERPPRAALLSMNNRAIPPDLVQQLQSQRFISPPGAAVSQTSLLPPSVAQPVWTSQTPIISTGMLNSPARPTGGLIKDSAHTFSVAGQSGPRRYFGS